MRKIELTIIVPFGEAHDRLAECATFVRRTQIEDAYFTNGGAAIARLRRQDTVSRLSCSLPLFEERSAENHETIVLDHRACLRLLCLFGFEPRETVRFTRETWKKHSYLIHLDRLENGKDALILEAEPFPGQELPRLRRTAAKLLAQLGFEAAASKAPARIDSPAAADYTAPVMEAASGPRIP